MPVEIPDELWSTQEEKVAKVILRGEGAIFLPPDIFLENLRLKGVIKNENIDDVKIFIHGAKNKRTIYGNLNVKHRQTFDILYQNKQINFLIIDPCPQILEVTLLHMPFETTPSVIKHIFGVLDDKCVVSDIRCVPGRERRHDRWQLMIQCESIDKIPHHFILPKRGPEKEDLHIKIFIEGRKTKDSRPSPPASAPAIAATHTPAPAHHVPPPPTPATRPAATAHHAPPPPNPTAQSATPPSYGLTEKNSNDKKSYAEVSSHDVPMPPPQRDDEDNSPPSYESRKDNHKSHQKDINALIEERNEIMKAVYKSTYH